MFQHFTKTGSYECLHISYSVTPDDDLRTCRRASGMGTSTVLYSSVIKSSDTGCFAVSFANSFSMKAG